MSSVILILHLGLQFKDNVQFKTYLIPCKKPPQEQPPFSPGAYQRPIALFGHGLLGLVIRPVAPEALGLNLSFTL